MSGIPGTATATDTSNIPAAGRGPIQGDGIIHEIQWSDALPWWLLFRAAGAAFSSAVILLAALGALAVWGGWSLADRLGIPAVMEVVEPAGLAGKEAGNEAQARALPLATSGSVLPLTRLPSIVAFTPPLPQPAADLLRLVAVPFNPAAGLSQMLGALARIGWFVAVWSIFGTAIARRRGGARIHSFALVRKSEMALGL